MLRSALSYLMEKVGTFIRAIWVADKNILNLGRVAKFSAAFTLVPRTTVVEMQTQEM